MEVFLIYPGDPSIQFLGPILDDLKSISSDGVFRLTVLKNEEETLESYSKLAYNVSRSPESGLYVFMGHGASNLLHGNVAEEIVLMDLNQARYTFANKNLISLSCRSSDFISSMGTLKSGIGFDSLPTDYQEIESEVLAGEYNVDHLTIAVIASKYREILLKSFSKSLSQLISENRSLTYLKNQIKLRLNKFLSQNVKSEMEDDQKLLCHLIYQTKVGITCIGDHHSLIF